MRITRITLENFRQHKNLEIDLDPSESSFTVIKGRNGAGKTNLLKAITWALTNKLAKDEAKTNPTSFVSFSALKDAKKGEIIEVSVRLDLDLGNSGLAQVARKARFVKTGNDLQDLEYSTSDLSVMTMENKSSGYQKDPNPDLWIERVFPDRFSHYFLFDGEHLHRFFKDTEANFVKKAVLEIANIDQLEKIVEHLSTVSQELIKEAGTHAGVRGEELRKDFEFVEKKIGELDADYKAKLKTLVELDEQLADAQQKMGDIEAIRKDIALRTQLESIAESASKRGADAKSEMHSWALRIGPSLMLSDQLQTLEAEIRVAKNNDVLPPPFKPEAIQELLIKESCICGRELKKASEPCKHVEDLLKKFNELSEMGMALSDLQEPLQLVKARVESSASMLESMQERIKTSDIEEKGAMSELIVLRQKLAGSDDVQVAFIAKKFETTKAERDSIIHKNGSLERQLQDQHANLLDIKKLIENEAATKEKSKAALKRQKFAQASLSVAEDMYIEFSNQVREKVASNLDEEFQAMVWKKNFFKPVEIDEDYRVMVYNKAGVEIRSLLSAGETACLAFAFSLTLSDVAGFSYPMVVDSPLGRLDAEVKEFVSGVLANALKADGEREGNQILMLMTDAEYNVDVADALAHMKPKVMEIIFDETTSETRLEIVK